MATRLNSSSALTTTQLKDVSFQRHRAHVFAGPHSGQASDIKSVRCSRFCFESLSREDVSQCRLSESSRLHLGPRDLPESSAVEKERDVALKVSFTFLVSIKLSPCICSPLSDSKLRFKTFSPPSSSPASPGRLRCCLLE